MGRPHSAKSGWPMRKKDTGVETTYGKAQLGRPPAKWTDDLVRIAGNRLMHEASNRSRWKSIGEAHVQQLTATSWYDDDETKFLCYAIKLKPPDRFWWNFVWRYKGLWWHLFLGNSWYLIKDPICSSNKLLFVKSLERDVYFLRTVRRTEGNLFIIFLLSGIMSLPHCV